MRATRRLPVLRHDAHARSSGRPGGRSACCSTRSLIWHKSRPVLSRCWFMWDYEPCARGLARRVSQPETARRPPANTTRPSGRSLRRRASRTDSARVHPTMQARRAHPPPDRLAHQARRAHLRALQRLRHGHHRRRADGPALLRDRARPGLRRRRRAQMAALHGQGRRPSRATAAASPRSPPNDARSRSESR